jgi:hypothetical protein
VASPDSRRFLRVRGVREIDEHLRARIGEPLPLLRKPDLPADLDADRERHIARIYLQCGQIVPGLQQAAFVHRQVDLLNVHRRPDGEK